VNGISPAGLRCYAPHYFESRRMSFRTDTYCIIPDVTNMKLIDVTQTPSYSCYHIAISSTCYASVQCIGHVVSFSFSRLSNYNVLMNRIMIVRRQWLVIESVLIVTVHVFLVALLNVIIIITRRMHFHM
jgi:hypothetical protein